MRWRTRNVDARAVRITASRGGPRGIGSVRLAMLVTLVSGTGLTGCVAGREFREAALPAIRTGTLAITTGLLEGLFAAIEPDP